VLVAPIVSEKATMIGEKRNQVLFKVLRDATKPEIKAAVEADVQGRSGLGADRHAKGQGPSASAVRSAAATTSRRRTSR
jgi:large subunit ribosomal protein L23